MTSATPGPALAGPKSARELLDMYFLDMRSHLLETASAFDRIERADGGATLGADPRARLLREACGIIAHGEGNRVERFLALFSD